MSSRPLQPFVAKLRRVAPVLIAMIFLGGCSTINRIAVNKLGNALAAGGTTFASDDDPELIRQATPFSLKLMESLLAQSPDHRGLLLAASSGFTQYGYAFVLQDADELEATDFALAEVMHARAKRLFLRARNHGLRGLDVAHPGFAAALPTGPRKAVRVMTKDDVPQLYWAAAAWGAAISLGMDDPPLIAEIPQMEALIDRAAELDESWGDGAIHGFLMSYELSRSGAVGDAVTRARVHFDRAVELAAGRLAGPFVTFAEAVCVEKQDAAQFDALLRRALAIDPDANSDFRLANLVMQRRARWLLAQKEDLFLLPTGPSAR